MLILDRKRGEGVHIGNDIYIRILGVTDHGHVKLGISAPDNTDIRRDELFRNRKRLGSYFYHGKK